MSIPSSSVQSMPLAEDASSQNASASMSSSAATSAISSNASQSAADTSAGYKRGRSTVRRDTKGVDSFRRALVAHLEQNARLSPLPPATTDILSMKPAVVNTVSESQRQQWLSDYSNKISAFTIKQLVKESVRFRFQCATFIILVPNWHALREALWAHLKRLGIKKAKRSVSTKEDLVNICIQDSVKFDFSEFVKDATSHGNKRKKKLRKIRPIISLQKTEMLQRMQQQQQQEQQQQQQGGDGVKQDDNTSSLSSYNVSSDSQSPPINSAFTFTRPLSAAEIIPHILSLPLSEIRLFHAWWQTYLAQTPAWTPLKFATTNAAAILNAHQYTNSQTNTPSNAQHIVSPTAAAPNATTPLPQPTTTNSMQTTAETFTSTSNDIQSADPDQTADNDDDDDEDDDDDFESNDSDDDENDDFVRT